MGAELNISYIICDNGGDNYRNNHNHNYYKTGINVDTSQVNYIVHSLYLSIQLIFSYFDFDMSLNAISSQAQHYNNEDNHYTHIRKLLINPTPTACRTRNVGEIRLNVISLSYYLHC